MSARNHTIFILCYFILFYILLLFTQRLTLFSQYSTDLAAPSLIKFGIESKHSCPLTSTDQFKSAVVESLREMAEIVLAAQDPAPTTPIVNEADKIKDEQTVMSRL